MTATAPQTLPPDVALQQAIAHHQAGRLQEAEKLYRAILKTLPDHPDANHNLGALAVQVKQAAAGIPHFKAALEANPSQGQYWLSYIDALIRAGQNDVAQQVLAQGMQRGLAGAAVDALELRLQAPEAAPTSVSMTPTATDIPAIFAPALALREAGDYSAATVWLHDWLGAASARCESAEIMATAHAHLAQVRLLDKLDVAASESIASALALAPTLPVVLRNHARLLLKGQKPDEAQVTAEQAARQAPSDPENLLVLAAALGAKKNTAQAMSVIERALQIRPDYAEALANRALLKLQMADKAGAKADLEAALALKPHLAQLWSFLASLRYELKDLSGAIAAFETAVAREPENVAWLLNLGELKRQAYQVPDAIVLLEKAVSLEPDNDSAWANFGVALHAAGQLERARDAYEKALAINPSLAEVASNLGALAMDAESWEAALAYFEQAARYQPSNPILLANKGGALLRLKRSPGEIEAVAQQILAMAPDNAAGYRLLGAMKKELGQLEKARDCFRAALEREPGSAELHGDLGDVLNELGDTLMAETHLRRALQLNPRDSKALGRLLFVTNYTASQQPEHILANAKKWETAALSLAEHKAASCQTFNRLPASARRLRIGYVSGDYRKHPLSYFVGKLFSSHDRAQVELFAYTTNHEHDAITDQLIGTVDHWTPLYGLSDEAAAAHIRDDEIDVLVDLSGHTHHNRLGIFARRAAPVQAHYLGFFGTTGLTEMDYWIGDEILIPPALRSHFCETVWCLPRTWISYAGAPEAPSPAWHPTADGTFTLGSFNNLGKITPATVSLWARVLHALPEARLLLKTKELVDGGNRSRILAGFAEHGIPAERIELQDQRITPEWSEHMAYYDRLDIALDPVGAVGGGTTTCDALWMGVPVIALSGDRMASRMTASMLMALDQPDWLAKNENDYVSRAVALARNVETRLALRFSQRERMARSALCDAKGLATALESAYQAMFARWQENQAAKV